MASKNISIALILTINLVFFGFTMAQAPGPQAPICPRSLTQVQACGNGLTSIVGGLNILTPRQCCTLVAELDVSLASVCICDAIKLSLLNGTVEISVRLGQILRSCGVAPPEGFICA
ncbi:unnamed protein product [Eruca vesicaria subsp. sativa]|uniref:Bifunctional inhibitor/plant lipid transfer protein/seed storage helical domain-containing protein n=1 Tax=Eruca vesicaria subsp. sativa TaxID=29727 RepID=A0ABC8J7H3_ERUVS|nr:unnamed protein product [Eruca vesicaria subsp. sativa]